MDDRVIRAEVVAKALRETPPAVKGIVVEDTMHRLVKWDGDGVARMFEFDGLAPLTYREVVARHKTVALEGGEGALVHLTISFAGQWVSCPACGRSLRAGASWWHHYNSAHAVRPYWINENDWPKMLKGPYRKPPELL